MMRTITKSPVFRCAAVALAAAAFVYVGILALLLSMQRFGCCPIFHHM